MNNPYTTPRASRARLAIDGQIGTTQKSTKSRLRFVKMLMLGAYGVMAIRLFDLTILPEFAEPAIEAARKTAEKSENLHFGRADIMDRSGILLATSLPASSVYADPKLITDPAAAARNLHQILPDISVQELENRLDREGRFSWIKRGITPAQAKAINALGNPGLGFRKETRRFYPHGALMSHIIGSANIDGKGQAGLEYYLDSDLSKRLSPLTTTLDIRLQYSARKALSHAIKRFDAIGGVAMIADIKQGQLLAAVSMPDFDPHHFGGSMGNATFTRFTHGAYEMGSTFKIFSTAAYLNANGNHISDIHDASEPLKIGRFKIHDYHAEEREMSVADIFLHSSNIGTALMAREIGTDALKQTYRRLGLLTSYDTAAIHTAPPLLPQVWREANTLTASYGHGIAVTPVHLMNAFITTLSDGTQKGVHIIPKSQNTKDHGGISTRVLDESTVDTMRRLLRLGVTHGTGQFADLEGYQIGGKTGTSEKIGGSGYNEDRLISSFIGAFPMHDPQYAIYVMVDEPKGRDDTYGYATGGWVAAPAVRSIVADMAAILSLPPVADSQAADAALLAPLMPYIKDKEAKQTARILRRGKKDFIPRFTNFNTMQPAAGGTE